MHEFFPTIHTDCLTGFKTSFLALQLYMCRREMEKKMQNVETMFIFREKKEYQK